MTIDEIISAAKSDISRQIAKGTWFGYDDCPEDGDGENFYSIVSLYAQWADDIGEAEKALWEMFEDDYPLYDHENETNS
jgi:hypothetical protein